MSYLPRGVQVRRENKPATTQGGNTEASPSSNAKAVVIGSPALIYSSQRHFVPRNESDPDLISPIGGSPGAAFPAIENMRPVASTSAITAPALTEQAPPTQAVTEQTPRAQASPSRSLSEYSQIGMEQVSPPQASLDTSMAHAAIEQATPTQASSTQTVFEGTMQASLRSGDTITGGSVQQGDNATPRFDPHPAEAPHPSVADHSQIASTSSQSDLDAPATSPTFSPHPRLSFPAPGVEIFEMTADSTRMHRTCSSRSTRPPPKQEEAARLKSPPQLKREDYYAPDDSD